MSESSQSTSTLKWDLLIKKRASATQGVPPGKEHLTWVANTVTLISGERDAILVDTFLTAEHCRELVEWVVASGKNLVAIYVTHAHGDHYFGLAPLLERFPAAKAIAARDVVEGIREQISPQFVKDFWEVRFPGLIPEKLVGAEALESNEFELEGHVFKVVDIGFTDTSNTTCLHVPSLDLVIAGDSVYGGVHPYLTETTRQTRLEWLAALDKIESLQPTAVIGGHKVPDYSDDPKNIKETRQYIQDFIRLEASTSTARELYDAMLALYPEWVNPGSLWASARAAKP
jgi:glyoxylase-like metal-dependent hydrolase (beta-lactamase superfamily II)